MVIPHLPENVLHHVFAHLPFPSFITCRAVCKEWQAILCHPTLLLSWIQLHNHYVSIHAQAEEEQEIESKSAFLIVCENPFPSPRLIWRPQIYNARGQGYVYSPHTRRAYPFPTDMVGGDARLVGIAEGDGRCFRVLLAAVNSNAFAVAKIYGDAKNCWVCNFYRFGENYRLRNLATTGVVFFEGVLFMLTLSSSFGIMTFDPSSNRTNERKNMVLPLAHSNNQIIWRQLARWKSCFILTSAIVEEKEKEKENGFYLKDMYVHSSNIDELQIWAEDHNSTHNPIWNQIAKIPSSVCGSFNDNSSGLSSYAEWESEVFADYLFCKARGSKEAITFDLKTGSWNSVANCEEIEAECVQRFVDIGSKLCDLTKDRPFFIKFF